MGFVLNEKGRFKYLTIPTLEKSGLILHGFSLKSCHSLKQFVSIFNISPAKGRINPKDLTAAEQVHQDKIAIIDEKKKGNVAKGCDALLTDIPGIPLVIRTADCVPIFLFDPKTKSIGLVHAGWKNSILNIAGKTIQTMKEIFGAELKNILVGIAPSIGPCCYEVKDNVIKLLKKAKKDWRNFVTTTGDGKWYLNLRKLNLSQLIEAGILQTNITISRRCTSCEKDMFYSYRRDGKGTGRMYALIMIK